MVFVILFVFDIGLGVCVLKLELLFGLELLLLLFFFLLRVLLIFRRGFLLIDLWINNFVRILLFFLEVFGFLWLDFLRRVWLLVVILFCIFKVGVIVFCFIYMGVFFVWGLLVVVFLFFLFFIIFILIFSLFTLLLLIELLVYDGLLLRCFEGRSSWFSLVSWVGCGFGFRIVGVRLIFL